MDSEAGDRAARRGRRLGAALKAVGAVILVVGTLAGCRPDQMVDASLDVRRCTDTAEEGIDIDMLTELAERADVPLDALLGFLVSEAYVANPKAWDFVFCLGYYGWECYGGTGVGTLNPTPPTECRSSGDTFLVVENPHT